MFPAARLRRRHSDCGKHPNDPARGNGVNCNAPSDLHRMRAELEAQLHRIPPHVAVHVTELADSGLDVFRIASLTGLPLPLINLILRGVTK
jgi:hypothetical protein